MNIKFVNEIQKILKERKNCAEELAEQNFEVARKNVQFSRIEKEENELKFLIAKNDIENKSTELEQKRLNQLETEKKKILKQLNLSEIDLIPSYFCKKCNDTGITFKNGVPVNCDCKKKILSEILLKDFGKKTLNSFENIVKDNNNSLLIEKMQKFCQKFPNINFQTIYICGKVGVGKTVLSECILNEMIRKNFYAYFATSFKMNQDFLTYCKSDNSIKNEIFEKYLESDLLIIDDLGTEPIIKNITLDYLYLILNERIVSGKMTIINSNLLPEEIMLKYGERIFSRIMNKRSGLVLKLDGEDKRLKK